MEWSLDALILGLHVPAGLLATLQGARAMLAAKGGAKHRRAGRGFVYALGALCVTGAGLVATRGRPVAYLLGFVLACPLLATIGYRARQRARATVHILGMAGAYVAMLTAFYVDNGPKLPIWRMLPASWFWFLPSLAAAPLLVRALRRHASRPDASL